MLQTVIDSRNSPIGGRVDREILASLIKKGAWRDIVDCHSSYISNVDGLLIILGVLSKCESRVAFVRYAELCLYLAVRGRPDSQYVEKHHIIPTSFVLEFKQLPANILICDADEHFRLHCLLMAAMKPCKTLYYKAAKAVAAFSMDGKGRQLNAEQRKVAREARANAPGTWATREQSLDHRKKNSAKQRGNTSAKGYKFTDEQRAHLRQVQSGRVRSKKTRENCQQAQLLRAALAAGFIDYKSYVTAAKEAIVEHGSLGEAARAIGISKHGMFLLCKRENISLDYERIKILETDAASKTKRNSYAIAHGFENHDQLVCNVLSLKAKGTTNDQICKQLQIGRKKVVTILHA